LACLRTSSIGRLLDVTVYDALTVKQRLEVDAFTKNGTSPSNEALATLLDTLLDVVEEVEREATPERLEELATEVERRA
jgi:hypothetical protein